MAIKLMIPDTKAPDARPHHDQLGLGCWCHGVRVGADQLSHLALFTRGVGIVAARIRVGLVNIRIRTIVGRPGVGGGSGCTQRIGRQ
jgi:hypothetical protein